MKLVRTVACVVALALALASVASLSRSAVAAHQWPTLLADSEVPRGRG
jgi:hypothetical protein